MSAKKTRTCSICNKTLGSRKTFIKHTKAHANGAIDDEGDRVFQLNPFQNLGKRKCPSCKNYILLEEIPEHVTRKECSTYVWCACNRFVEKTVGSLAGHGRVCAHAKKLADDLRMCPECGKICQSAGQMERHRGSVFCDLQRPKNGTICGGCETEFDTIAEWRRHQDNCTDYADLKSKGVTKCLRCRERVPTVQEKLLEHMKSCGSVLCPCGVLMGGDTRKHLSDHIFRTKCTHAKQALQDSLTCKECDLVFQYPETLARHMLIAVHGEERDLLKVPYPCHAPDCDIIFRTEMTRKSHQAQCPKYKALRKTGWVPPSKRPRSKAKAKKIVTKKKPIVVVVETPELTWTQTTVVTMMRSQPTTSGYENLVEAPYRFTPDLYIPIALPKIRVAIEVDNDNEVGYNGYVEAQKRRRHLKDIGWKIIHVSQETVFFRTEDVGNLVMEQVKNSWKDTAEPIVTL